MAKGITNTEQTLKDITPNLRREGIVVEWLSTRTINRTFKIYKGIQNSVTPGVADLINHVQGIMWNRFALTNQELRILFTMYRATTSHSPAVVENARKIWRDNILNVKKIPHTTIFTKSYDKDKKLPVSALDPKHPGSIAYDVLAEWLINYEKAQS